MLAPLLAVRSHPRSSHLRRRDREERDALKDAEEERERVRTMTAEERAAFERDNPRVVYKPQKKAWKFMQKYWHRGAFFQETSDGIRGRDQRPDDIFLRDYSAPTGEDKLNKEMLPKVHLALLAMSLNYLPSFLSL